MGLQPGTDLCDRTNCIRERLRHRGLVHAGISMRSSERGKEDSCSIHREFAASLWDVARAG